MTAELICELFQPEGDFQGASWKSRLVLWELGRAKSSGRLPVARETHVGQSTEIRTGMAGGEQLRIWVLCPVSVFPVCVWFQWRIAGCGALPCSTSTWLCPCVPRSTCGVVLPLIARGNVFMCLKSFHFFSSPISGNSGLTSSVLLLGCGSGRVEVAVPGCC